MTLSQHYLPRSPQLSLGGVERRVGRPHALLSDISDADDDDDDASSSMTFNPYTPTFLNDSFPFNRTPIPTTYNNTGPINRTYSTLSTASTPVFPQHRANDMIRDSHYEPNSKTEHFRNGPQLYNRDQQQPHPQRSMSMVEKHGGGESGMTADACRRYRSSTILYQSFLRTIEEGHIQLASQLRDELQHMVNEGMNQSNSAEMGRDKSGLMLQVPSADEGWLAEGIKMQDIMTEKLKQAQNRMLKAHVQIRAILEQDYRFQEGLPPRLFIVLPKDGFQWDASNPRNNRFRLYFLCDCGEHTKPSSSHGQDARLHPRGQSSQIPHHIHLANHEGYDIVEQELFFFEFGSYILNLLYMFKYGISIAGYYVPVLMPPKAVGSMPCGINHAFNNFAYDIAPGVNQVIDYLQSMLVKGLIPTTLTETEARQQNRHFDLNNERSLEVIDLKRLNNFLKIKGTKASPLGNMHRMVTNGAYVKWVCSDHFGEAFDAMSIRELSTTITTLGGKFDEHLGRVEVSLQSSSATLKFYKTMERAAIVHDFAITLEWEVSTSDLKSLLDMVQRSNILSLTISCSPPKAAINILNRKKKRADPLWEMMSIPNLHSFILRDYLDFFSCVSLPAKTNYLRKLEIHERVDWKKEGNKVVELLRHCPGLTDLHLGCDDVEQAYQAIERVTIGFCPLEKITLDGGENSGIQARLKARKLVWMELMVSDLSSPLLYGTPSLRSLHLRPRIPADFEPHTLESVIAKVPQLTTLKIHCPVSKFQLLFMLIKEAASMNQASELNGLILYDLRNQLYSNNLKGQANVKLELMSLSNYYEAVDLLIQDFGSRLTKLKIEGQGFRSLSPLAKALRKSGSSMLENLVIACSPITSNILQDLRTILQITSGTLTQVTLVIYEVWDTTSKNLSDLADFIVHMEPLWTKIMVGDAETAAWKQVLRSRGFNAPDGVFKRGPSLARLTDLEVKYGLVPNQYVYKVSTKPAVNRVY